MTNIVRMSTFAEISLVSYGALLIGNTNSQVNLTALINAGMSERQANDFATRL